MKNNNLKKELLQLGGTLFIICAVVALALGFVDNITRDKIKAMKQEKINLAMSQVAGKGAKFEPVDFSGEDKIITDIHKIVRDGSDAGYCLQVEPNGFAGAVTLIVGVDADGSVLGVKVISHSETPGLGANADNAKWLKQYQGLGGTLNVVKTATGNKGDIVALSGATITSRGVTKGVQAAIDYAMAQK
ncbi:RnfABCDGE type electron transport complex subunit G [Acidaminobacterium chupaoyuni]